MSEVTIYWQMVKQLSHAETCQIISEVMPELQLLFGWVVNQNFSNPNSARAEVKLRICDHMVRLNTT